MTPATEFYAYAIGFQAALVAVIAAVWTALHLWERRVIGPVSDDEIEEYAAAHARTDDEWDAILAAVDWDALDAEVRR